MRALILALSMMSLAGAAVAQNAGGEVEDGASGAPAPKPDPARDAEMRRQMEETVRQLQRRNVEKLRRMNSRNYAKQKETLETQEQIDQILTSARKGDIADKEAKEALFPLLKPKVDLEAEHLEEHISRLEAEIAFLKRARKSPDLLVERRAEELLGKRIPDGDEGRCR